MTWDVSDAEYEGVLKAGAAKQYRSSRRARKRTWSRCTRLASTPAPRLAELIGVAGWTIYRALEPARRADAAT